MLAFKKNLFIAAIFSSGLYGCVSTSKPSQTALGNGNDVAAQAQKKQPSDEAVMPSIGMDPKMAQAMAFNALREHLNDDQSDIELIKMSTITWPDASLGCARPGLKYSQGLISGYQVELKANNEDYNVHVAQKRAFVCTDNKKKFIVPPPKTGKKVGLDGGHMSELAKQDLASKIGVNVNAIKVLSSTPVTWPNKNLACDNTVTKEGKTRNNQPTTAGVDGYRIVLANKGRQFVYHSDEFSRVMACPKIEDA